MFLVSNDMTATLPARSSLRVVADPGERVAVRCTAGELWLIRDGDPKDSSLAPSESFVLPDAGHVELYAIQPSTLRVTRCKAAAPPRQGWRQWLRRLTASPGQGYAGPEK